MATTPAATAAATQRRELTNLAATVAAHVLVFPASGQGHINCIMHFAMGDIVELLESLGTNGSRVKGD
uniref:Uncharacterized protein n=1 Tax=Oryza rufipogon TaxID=4529 RepID=A0A0E0MXJ8_ORYRU